MSNYLHDLSNTPNTYIVEVVHDTGASFENKMVVCQAFNAEDAFKSVKTGLEKNSDDLVTHIFTRLLSDTDMIIGYNYFA